MRTQLSISHRPRTFTLAGHGPLLIMKIQYVRITGSTYDSFELALIIILEDNAVRVLCICMCEREFNELCTA